MRTSRYLKRLRDMDRHLRPKNGLKVFQYGRLRQGPRSEGDGNLPLFGKAQDMAVGFHGFAGHRKVEGPQRYRPGRNMSRGKALHDQAGIDAAERK